MVANAGGKKLSSLPFPAIVGQEELKRVLLAVAANDGLDGALITGEKGTAKSTAVRALVDLLPKQRAVADCPYGCSPDDSSQQCDDCRGRDPADLPVETRPVPLVTLPLGATRDRVVGTLSVEDALAGEADFDPGLLARANRGILYVDEVNLLDDHLVDVILDAAASGVNTVERDGISVSHPADFTLIGTMNPEEGDLRPQLRDRFALQATVEGCREIDDRVEIIDRALEAESDPDPETAYTDEVDALREELAAARERLSSVDLPADFKAEIADLCLAAGVDGHRGDVATARTAMTLATLEGRETVIESDVHEAATYTLPHRLRSTPFEDEPDLDDLLEDRFDEESPDDADGEGDGDDDDADGGDGDESEPEPEPGDGDEDGGSEESDDGSDGADGDGSSDGGDGDERDDDGPEQRPEGGKQPAQASQSSAETGDGGSDDDSSERDSESDESSNDEDSEDETAQPLVPGQQRAGIGEAAAPDLETATVEGSEGATATGSRASTAPSTDNRGARVRTEPASGEGSIDAAASVRSAATRGESRVAKQDLRQSVRAGETSVTIVFAVDASASMRPAMRTAKGVVLELLRDSYEHRDQVAFVAFAGEDADVLLPPTDSVSLAARHLKDLPSGDRTPLPAGLETSRQVIERADTDASVVVLVTDGRANVADGSPTAATRKAARALATDDTRVVVVDAGDDSRAGLSQLVASETDGERVDLSTLSVERVRAAAERAADESQRS
ncbi:VWA domain-containing protein [Natrinema hispanicum]|uniref:Protoporphyrin IX magnesium-chelatase n=1 Tax=Natrinema hispanicum TaxID=392421 RepID=A0A1G6K2G7_9EURY|nr:VWA domain-containing protein [Natrinema hispanicum]SDC25061.1 protoporphyrin IX magnesium-chelatase [Natrinema hispanicum]SES73162.1 protoporphyrin IX magnesium-chelatase [Natrinema hispanicum]